MRLTIRGTELPGLTCGPYTPVHVGLQVRREPVDLVAADATSAQWVTDVDVVDGDFRGPAVHGKRGERFVYLTWGTVQDGRFEMFRRAKLMLGGLPTGRDRVEVVVRLTDGRGMPLCARIPASAMTVT